MPSIVPESPDLDNGVVYDTSEWQQKWVTQVGHGLAGATLESRFQYAWGTKTQHTASPCKLNPNLSGLYVSDPS